MENLRIHPAGPAPFARFAPALLVLALAAGGSSGGGAPAQDADRARPPADATLAFGLDLYRALGTGPENRLISPCSIATALAMVRAGARGETAAQIDRVLHHDSSATPAAHRALREALRPGVVRDGGGDDAKLVDAFALHTANALWLQVGLDVEEPFAATLARDFAAPAERIDFRRVEAARTRINEWVAAQTRDRIRDIVPEGLPVPETRLALANAVYFKAAWAQPFEEDQTRDGRFHTGPDTSVAAAFMHRTEVLGYAEDDEVQVVELPYRGHETSMVIVLPRARDGLAGVEANLSAAAVRGWLGRLHPRNVALELPRFRFTAAVAGLPAVLRALGMVDAFTARADFSGLTRAERLFLSEVLHKAFINVDEAGTEAAAATVVMMLKGLPPGEPVAFAANRPFLFLIRHVKTGAVLFLGCVRNPA